MHQASSSPEHMSSGQTLKSRVEQERVTSFFHETGRR